VQLDGEAHLVGGIGEAQRVLVADAAGLVQVEQRLVCRRAAARPCGCNGVASSCHIDDELLTGGPSAQVELRVGELAVDFLAPDTKEK
jgi:hypothetical protein